MFLKKFVTILLFLSVVQFLSSEKLHAQAGLRFDVGYNSMSAKYHMPEYIAAGYLQDVGDKVSLGISYRYGIDFEERTGSDNTYSFRSNADLITLNVDEKNHWYQIVYSAKYHFSGCEEGAYISHSISCFWATHENYIADMTANDVYLSSYQDVGHGSTYSDKIKLFPFSLDLGYRTDFDEWFYDFSIGFTYLPFGKSKNYVLNGLKSAGAKMDYPGLSFQIGICTGVAW